jgi:hypothetical protein
MPVESPDGCAAAAAVLAAAGALAAADPVDTAAAEAVALDAPLSDEADGLLHATATIAVNDIPSAMAAPRATCFDCIRFFIGREN